MLITGNESHGTHDLCRKLVCSINQGTRADSLESIRDEYCRIIRPRSKSRRILIEDIRAVEPFLRQKAALNKWKIAVFLDAERMNEEAANAFLKTLEEPPGHSLIILISSKPEQLLQTILSRCVNVPLYSPDFTINLTPIQEKIIPCWIDACNHIGDDLAALGFRSNFLNILAEHKAELSKTITQSVKEEAKSATQGTDSSLEIQNKDTLTAFIETEYLSERDSAIDILILWMGQAALIASGNNLEKLVHDDVRKLAEKLSAMEIIRRMNAIENMKNDLRFNVHEGLCVDVGMLGALGQL